MLLSQFFIQVRIIEKQNCTLEIGEKKGFFKNNVSKNFSTTFFHLIEGEMLHYNFIIKNTVQIQKKISFVGWHKGNINRLMQNKANTSCCIQRTDLISRKIWNFFFHFSNYTIRRNVFLY